MKCREAQHDMALHLGHDGPDPVRWDQVRRHVAQCRACRESYAHLKSALRVLEQADAPATYDEVRGSLWPKLESRLDEPRPLKVSDRGTWMSVSAVVVACLLFVSVWNGGTAHAPSPAERSVPRHAVAPVGEWFPSGPHLSREAREADARARRAREAQMKAKAPTDL